MSWYATAASLAGSYLGGKGKTDPRAYGKGKGRQLSAAGGIIGGMPIGGAALTLPAGTIPTGAFVGGSLSVPMTLPGSGVVNSFLSAFDPRPTTSAGGVIDSMTPDFLVRPMGYRKRRRMNPLNVRAARRAIRRIKAVRKITADIERSLPKAKARAARPRFQTAR